MIRRPPRSTRVRSSAASDVYKRQTDQIIESLSPNVRKKGILIREILDREISQSAAVRLQVCLDLIKHLDDEVKFLEREIFNYAYGEHKREMEILMSVPGIG